MTGRAKTLAQCGWYGGITLSALSASAWAAGYLNIVYSAPRFNNTCIGLAHGAIRFKVGLTAEGEGLTIDGFRGWDTQLWPSRFMLHPANPSAHPAGYEIELPLWIPLAPGLLSLGAAGWSRWRAARRSHLTCPSCGYDLRGLAPDSICPDP